MKHLWLGKRRCRRCEQTKGIAQPGKCPGIPVWYTYTTHPVWNQTWESYLRFPGLVPRGEAK